MQNADAAFTRKPSAPLRHLPQAWVEQLEPLCAGLLCICGNSIPHAAQCAIANPHRAIKQWQLPIDWQIYSIWMKNKTWRLPSIK
jgi:hypothetical protein